MSAVAEQLLGAKRISTLAVPARRQTGLSLGLITLALVSVFALALLSRPFSTPLQTESANQRGGQPNAPQTDSSPLVADLLETLASANPAAADRYIQAAPLLPNQAARRVALLETVLTVLRQEAPYMRYASLGAFTDLLIAFGNGMSALKAADSSWCEASTIADLTRRNETELMPYLLAELASEDESFEWALGFAKFALTATIDARRSPVRHGPRTRNDEAVVQFYGRLLGVERLSVALSVAAFSHSEGRDFATMQDAIRGVDVCELADAFVELSERLPNDVKGRVMAELAPEIFYGNTPYVLYLFRGYFFIG